MYKNTNITLDITVSNGEKHTLVFLQDANGKITITSDDKPINILDCHQYCGIFNKFSKLLYNHMTKLMIL